MQLKGKKSTYEVYKEQNIEKTIQKAVQDGYTNVQKKYFVEHIAGDRMEKN